MSRHHTKLAVTSPSQTLLTSTAKTGPDATLETILVMLCDWHGQLVWKSASGDRLQIGDYVWKGATHRSMESMQTAVASVVTLRESRTLEVENERGELFRVRMWPLSEPEVAICLLAMIIPGEIALLTEREKGCLRLLAQGQSTRDIAKKLDIGLTTVHTHLRRCREKLGLANPEALISFAARYFFAPSANELRALATVHKRSG
jgi:ATP/maltotriose-dependent transcriptional regulator MalT